MVPLLPCVWEPPLRLPKAAWPTARILAPFCGVHSLPFPVWPVLPISDSLAFVSPRSSFTPLILGPQTSCRVLCSVSDRPLPLPCAPGGEEGLSQHRAASASWPCLWGKLGIQFSSGSPVRALKASELRGTGGSRHSGDTAWEGAEANCLGGRFVPSGLWETLAEAEPGSDLADWACVLNSTGQMEVISSVSS